MYAVSLLSWSITKHSSFSMITIKRLLLSRNHDNTKQVSACVAELRRNKLK